MAQGRAIAFELRDRIGNSFGTGCKAYINYGPGESRHQVRELKLSGGFLSYDAPVIHFGLGDFDTVSRVDVVWSTGERDTLRGSFRHGGRYRITRQPEVAGESGLQQSKFQASELAMPHR